jgi:hypothetical protein
MECPARGDREGNTQAKENRQNWLSRCVPPGPRDACEVTAAITQFSLVDVELAALRNDDAVALIDALPDLPRKQLISKPGLRGASADLRVLERRAD